MRLIPALREIEPEFLQGQFAFGIETNLSGTPAMDKLWEYISSAKENPKPYNAELAGNISSSLVLNDTDNWFFVNACIPIIGKYKEFFKKTTAFNSQSISKNDLPYGLDNFWVNFENISCTLRRRSLNWVRIKDAMRAKKVQIFLTKRLNNNLSVFLSGGSYWRRHVELTV